MSDPNKNSGILTILSTFVGNCGTLVLQPLELIKTRFQVTDGASNNLVPTYNGLKNAIMKIYSEEGFRAFYRGVMVYFVGLNIANMSFFYTYFLV